MKQFVKALDKNNYHNFPKLNSEGSFVGPQTKTLCKHIAFLNSMTSIEKNAWNSFK